VKLRLSQRIAALFLAALVALPPAYADDPPVPSKESVKSKKRRAHKKLKSQREKEKRKEKREAIIAEKEAKKKKQTALIIEGPTEKIVIHKPKKPDFKLKKPEEVVDPRHKDNLERILAEGLAADVLQALEEPHFLLEKKDLPQELLIYGEGEKIHAYFKNLYNELRLPGDPDVDAIKFSVSMDPNANFVQFKEGFDGEVKKTELWFNLGLLPFLDNEDQLAGLIAHEMTHSNHEMFKQLKHKTVLERIMANVEGVDVKKTGQREEVRADISAIFRLIKAKRNPWATYESFYKLEKYQGKKFFG